MACGFVGQFFLVLISATLFLVVLMMVFMGGAFNGVLASGPLLVALVIPVTYTLAISLFTIRSVLLYNGSGTTTAASPPSTAQRQRVAGAWPLFLASFVSLCTSVCLALAVPITLLLVMFAEIFTAIFVRSPQGAMGPFLLIGVVFLGVPLALLLSPAALAALGMSMAASRLRQLALFGTQPPLHVLSTPFGRVCNDVVRMVVTSPHANLACASLGVVTTTGITIVIHQLGQSAMDPKDPKPQAMYGPTALYGTAAGFALLGVAFAGAAWRSAGSLGGGASPPGGSPPTTGVAEAETTGLAAQTAEETDTTTLVAHI